MNFYVLSYRFWRLRRLIGLAVVVPTLLALFFAAFAGSWLLILLVLTVGLPVAHALRYPGEWLETLIVSGVLSVAMLLVAVLGIFTGPIGDVGLVILAVPVSLVSVLWLTDYLSEWVEEGPVDTLERSVTLRTRVPQETLRETIVVRPGMKDERVHCSDADDSGIFTITHRRATMILRGEEITTEPVQYRARLIEDSEGAHEVRGVTDRGREVSSLRTSYRALRRGAVLTVEEVTEPMTEAQAFGLWLTDSLADYVTDILDRAAGCPQRSFRCMPADGFVDEVRRRYNAHLAKTEAASKPEGSQQV